MMARKTAPCVFIRSMRRNLAISARTSERKFGALEHDCDAIQLT
jgi:hypothetical protein